MRLGFWSQVYGNWLLSDHPELSDASFEHAKKSTRFGTEVVPLVRDQVEEH